MRMLGGIVLLVLVQAVAGCGDSGPSPVPSAPSPASQTGSPGVSQPGPQPTPSVSGISGFVLDTGFRPVAGARVEVVDGPHAGTSATADSTGQVSLTGTFDSTTRFRASKEGHVAATQTWNCSAGACAGPSNARPWLGFYLEVLAPSVNIAGDYTLTFIADRACTDLPDEMRTRTYTATLSPGPRSDTANTSFKVTVGGAPFVGGLGTFVIGVAGDYLGFWLNGGHDPALVEQITADTHLAFSGSASTSVGTSAVSTISAAFEGWIDYYGQAVARVHCESTNHRLILARR